MIYLFIGLLLAFLSFRYDINGKTRGRDFWYLFVLVCLILIAGLRYRIGTDTPLSMDIFYNETVELKDLSFDYLSVKYPLWNFLNSLVYTLTGKFFVLQLIQATTVNVLIFKYIKKHSDYLFVCLFFYYLMMYFTFNMEEMKSSLSVVVCLFGNDYILEKKWAKGFLLYFIGCLFHFSTYPLIFLIPFIHLLKMNKWGGIILVMAFVGGYIIQKIMGDYLMLLEFSEDLSDKAETYAESERYGESRGLGYFIRSIIPPLLYIVSCFFYIKKYYVNNRLIKMEPFLVICLMFLMVQANIPIFYRYYHFFEIYSVFFFSFVAVRLIKDNKRLSFGVSTMRSFLIFFPFIVTILWGFRGTYYRYYPYYTVIERKTDKLREMKQREFHPDRQLPEEENF